MPASSHAAEWGGIKRLVSGVHNERPYLRATLPCQLLNVYGRASYVQLDEKSMWQHLPLKTGAQYMTPSMEAERRGVGLNRYLQILVDFCQYQKMAEKMAVMKEAM